MKKLLFSMLMLCGMVSGLQGVIFEIAVPDRNTATWDIADAGQFGGIEKLKQRLAEAFIPALDQGTVRFYKDKDHRQEITELEPMRNWVFDGNNTIYVTGSGEAQPGFLVATPREFFASPGGGAAADAARAGTFSVTIRDIVGRRVSIGGLTATTTVAELKEKIAADSGWDAPVEQQQLSYAGGSLEDRRKLEDYRVGDGSTIRLTVIEDQGFYGGGAAEDAARAGTFSVTIKDITGPFFSIDGLTPETTVAQLKGKIADEWTVSVDKQRLLFAGNEFEDGKTLQDYEVRSDAVIRLFTRRTGSGGGGDAPRSAAAAASSDSHVGDGGGGGASTPVRTRRSGLNQGQKVLGAAAAAVTVAALTAAVKSIMSIRSYRRMKNKLVRKYDLGNLTDLQDKVWMATFVSHRMPYFLHRLVRNNAGKTLTDFTGKDPLALAHFYYGHKPSQAEYDDFIAKFFSSVNQ